MEIIEEFLGIGFIFVFLISIIGFVLLEKKGFHATFREIAAYKNLKREQNVAIEGGKRIHITLGHGGLADIRAGAGFVGLSLLKHIMQTGSQSDQPPVSSSGESVLSIFAEDTQVEGLKGVNIGRVMHYEPTQSQLTGLTPWSYAAGTIPILQDKSVTVNIIVGNLSSEVGLLTEAALEGKSLVVGGSDNLVAQAVMYASIPEPVVGEELYASPAYLREGLFDIASVRAQDLMRWLVIGLIVSGIVLKISGIL